MRFPHELQVPVQTVPSGTRHDVLQPRPEDIHLADVAYHLAGIRRFNGATDYPVSQHCVWVSRHVPAPFARTAFMHDWHEYVLGDVITPTHHALVQLVRSTDYGIDPLVTLKETWDSAIALRFDNPQLLELAKGTSACARLVKTADTYACRLEAEAFLPYALEGYGPPVPEQAHCRRPGKPLDRQAAIEEFMARATELGITG